MQILSHAQPRPSILVKNYVEHNDGNYNYKMAVGFDSQWALRSRTKNNALFAKEKRKALGHGSHFFARDNQGHLNFKPFYLGGRNKNKVAVVMAAAKAKDYYSILKVSETASNQDVKSADRKFARQVLSDEGMKSLYDQYGESGLDGAYQDAAAGPPRVTGSKFQNSGRQQGNDIRFDLPVSFKEAVVGVVKEFEICLWMTCDICMGSGKISGASSYPCQTCKGKGYVEERLKCSVPKSTMEIRCSKCKGDKVTTDPHYVNPCGICGGDGRVNYKKVIRLEIPPGVSSGNTIRLSGDTNYGERGGPAGDLNVFLIIQEIPRNQRDGVNIHSVTINYTQAILGTILEVKTLEGFKTLEIPAGTQPGDVLVMHNMGVSNHEKLSTQGDHLFVVNVAIPQKISEEEHKLVEKLAHFHDSSTPFLNFSKGEDQSANRKKDKQMSTESKVAAERENKNEPFGKPVKNMRRSEGSRNKFSSMSIQAMVSQEYPLVASSNPPLTCHLFFPSLYFFLFICFSYMFREIQAKFNSCNFSLASDNLK